jgi:hypothetical protein
MIELLGSKEGREYKAALKLCDLLLESWPWLETDPHSDAKIIVGVQCHGQSHRDLDIVLLGSFSERAVFSPFVSFSTLQGTLKKPDTVRVNSLCLVIEVKDHDLASVEFTGTRLDVLYTGSGHTRWHSVTDQSEGQKYALKRYLEHNRVNPPYITNLIWLPNVANADLPRRPHNILGGNSSWDLFLNVVMQLAMPRFYNGEWLIGAISNEQSSELGAAVNVLTRKIEPTSLDRAKMDQVCRAAVRADWVSFVGNKQVTFHGRGGAGKTVILLRLAWKIYQERQARVLLLTYNKALVADLRRLFTLMNLSDDIGRNTIQIQTVHSFFHSALQGLNVLSKDDDFLTNYEKFVGEALSYLESETITQADIDKLAQDRTNAFTWDYIFIDEAQDWFEEERDLLRRLYPPNTFVIADGGDQLVRRDASCNWREGLLANAHQTIKLKKSLRMKAGLTRFVTAFASFIGTGWEAEPNIEAPGGKIIIVEGDYFKHSELHEELVRETFAAGNYPIDMLICVPPSSVEHDSAGDNSNSFAGRTLVNRGSEVWDGVSVEVRDSYPTSINQLRIVQYDSCRGLEGWTVINLGLDEFYEHKRRIWHIPNSSEPGVLRDDPAQAHRYAARWLMIPLTRAIDTLVIQIDSTSSPIGTALKKAAELCSDSVLWKTNT